MVYAVCHNKIYFRTPFQISLCLRLILTGRPISAPRTLLFVKIVSIYGTLLCIFDKLLFNVIIYIVAFSAIILSEFSGKYVLMPREEIDQLIMLVSVSG